VGDKEGSKLNGDLMDNEKETRLENILETTLNKHHLLKNEWLNTELLKGLETLGVKVWLEEEPMSLLYPFKSILRIQTADGKKYAAGLTSRIRL
jgi:hypothetical protein